MDRTTFRPLILMAVLLGIIAAAFFIGCSHDGGTFDGHVGIIQPNITGPDLPQFHPYPPSDWQPAPKGQPENPGTVPGNCDCPPQYTATYNGWNWLCVRGTDREFPHKNAYCNVQR